MKTYIISLVLMRVMPVLDGNGQPQMSLQNEVNVISTEDDTEAGRKECYNKCAEFAKMKHEKHNIVLRTILDMDEVVEDKIG